MITKKRIEYIDALRGFTMILVVTVHVYSLCFMQGNDNEYDLSYHNFFGLFRMPLFFFISGFVFYKVGREWNYYTLKKFIANKVRVQLFSTLIFFSLFCFLFQRDIVDSVIDGQKAGYWFTYVLFVYFILYIGIDKTTCLICQKKPYNRITIITSIFVGFILYYLINNGFLLNVLSPQMTSLLSIGKWQYFLYFSFGCYIHKYYTLFLKLQDYDYLKGTFFLVFVCCSIGLFYQNSTEIIIHNYILKIFAGLLGIMLVMFLFKENESHFSSTTKLGNCLQYIGKHTLDIYFLHYFFLPYNLSFVGRWLNKYPSPLLEFCTSLLLAFIVITCCIFVSKIIRTSPTIAFLLLGGKGNQRK